MTSKQRTAEGSFAELVGIMARLRGPQGCPWDREQDHRSLRRCLLEEAYEVLEAIDAEDAEALRQELGDVLLQVVFHAQLAAEAGEFGIEDVVTGLRDKLVARHPHVFGGAAAETAEEVLHQWDSLKREEQGVEGKTPLTDVPKALPALARAQVVRRRASRAGLGRSAGEARAAAEDAIRCLEQEGVDGAATERAVSELLLAVVDLACAKGVDAEQALRERIDTLLADPG
jgi:tetrapyrrole methylase family protein/MazG family protein